jgi:tRNA threonylcarbamoyladenosine biosynthesis protein TsaE
MFTVKTSNAEETVSFAERIGGLLKSGDVIAFKGGLGAGKTTFTRGLSVGLGTGDRVSSPTYALVNEYPGQKLSLYHFDMYRVTNRESFETTGFFDYLSHGGVIAVEWSENIADVIDELPDVITVEIARTDIESEREIAVSGGRFGGRETVAADGRLDELGTLSRR